MLEARNVGRFANMLVQITIDLMSDDLRLRRLLCRKALPFRRAQICLIVSRETAPHAARRSLAVNQEIR